MQSEPTEAQRKAGAEILDTMTLETNASFEEMAGACFLAMTSHPDFTRTDSPTDVVERLRAENERLADLVRHSRTVVGDAFIIMAHSDPNVVKRAKKELQDWVTASFAPPPAALRNSTDGENHDRAE